MPSQNYANLRFSELDEIKTDNVANLKAAWTMSTGATRGHEGQPLVIGDTMYFESAYPNHVLRDRSVGLSYQVAVHAETGPLRHLGCVL